MRISSVHIRSYRCLKDLTIEMSDYSALVGANGSGKSSVLYALDWFFNNGPMNEDDLHTTTATKAAGEEASEVDVEVAFSNLNDQDRLVLGSYARGDTVRLRRIWSKESGKDKMIGNSSQGPGFAAARVPGIKAPELKQVYAALKTDLPELPPATTTAAIIQALAEWEDDPAHVGQLVEVESSDATHMFGFNGENTLSQRIRFVLVPASTDIAGQVGSTGGRESALKLLVGSLVAEAIQIAQGDWETTNADKIADLTAAVKDGVEKATQHHADRINANLAGLIPSASIEFKTDVPGWSAKPNAQVFTDVIIDGERTDVARQGHGVQRAVMMSMLQTLVPDDATAIARSESGDPTDAEKEARLIAERAKLPALVVAIEEPEIYQHPIRARSFARVLSALAAKPGTQIFFATHSPFFVLPEQFESLRRFTLANGETVVTQTTVAEVATACGVHVDKVKRAIEKELPRTFSEGFFAEAVAVVEGDTDRVVLETICENLGLPLDAAGTAVLAMGGKGNIRIPCEILKSLGIKVFVLADADFLGAKRHHPSDLVKEGNAHASHQTELNNIQTWLDPGATVTHGNMPYQFGDPTVVTSGWALLHDDLESELAQWPEFMTELGTLGGALRDKNVALYRSAAADAATAGLPAPLNSIANAIANFH